jgi:hypothetical protein
MRIFRRWGWVLVLLLFCAGVGLKLNGSSVGMWEQELLQREASKGLILFKPQPIRTDEWLVWTPAALCQAHQIPRFPVENPNLGPGRAPLLLNLPVAYYTTWFRPQLWGFFILDFERGFSFCWLAKIFGLVLAPAWLLRQLGVQSRALALFSGLWIFLAVQWWLSSPTMLPEMVASWAICTGCVVLLFTLTSRWRLAIALSAFVYCGVNFVLCSYPPAQIPLLYLMAAIVVGFIFERRQGGEFCCVKRGMLLTGVAISVIIIVLVPCWIDMRPTLEIVSHTIYPGARRSSGGGLSLFRLFSGLADFFLTRQAMPAAYQNITEASYSYPIWPAVVAGVLAARWRLRLTISPLFIALTILIICLSLYCTVPLPNWILRSTLLRFTTEHSTRLPIALANVFLACLFLDRYRVPVFTKRGTLVALAVFSLATALLFWTASLQKPNFFPDRQQIVLSFVASVALLALFFHQKHRSWFPLLLIALLVLTTGRINPVMRGLAPLLDSEGFRTVEKIHRADPNAKWIVYRDLALPELVKATGARVVNGFKIVPDLDFLHRFDPTRQANFVYNRYGHLVCELPEYPGQIAFKFVAADYYILYLSPGDFELRQIGCRYVVLPDIWPDAELHGFSLFQTVPEERICIYRRQ